MTILAVQLFRNMQITSSPSKQQKSKQLACELIILVLLPYDSRIFTQIFLKISETLF